MDDSSEDGYAMGRESDVDKDDEVDDADDGSPSGNAEPSKALFPKNDATRSTRRVHGSQSISLSDNHLDSDSYGEEDEDSDEELSSDDSESSLDLWQVKEASGSEKMSTRKATTNCQSKRTSISTRRFGVTTLPLVHWIVFSLGIRLLPNKAVFPITKIRTQLL